MADEKFWVAGEVISAEKLNIMEDNLYAIDNEYEKTTWKNGDIITAELLNKMELGLSTSTKEWTNGDELTETNLNALADEIDKEAKAAI